MDAIKLRGVTKTFGALKAVDDLSLAVPEGAIYGFIGPNGSGKTTTMRMIVGIFHQDSGSIEVFGQEMTGIQTGLIGYLPEERGLYRKMKVRSLLEFHGELRGGGNIPREVDRWLERFGLSAFADKKVETLSKGMTQKVQFIAAVVPNPRLVILDEPFTGLDPVNAESIREAILDLRQRGTTVVLSTHDMGTAEAMCDSILMIFRGRKVLDGTLKEIQDQYGNDTVRAAVEGGVPAGLPGVESVRDLGQLQEIRMTRDADPQELLGGSFIALAVMKNKPDIADRHIAIVDRTGIAAATVIRTVQEKNEHDLIDKYTHSQGMPRYRFETVVPDEAHRDQQKLALSRRVRPADLYAFIEIGAQAVDPDGAGDRNPENGIAWYSNESGIAEARRWLSGPLNDGIRRVRLEQAGVAPSRFGELLGNVEIRSLSLLSRDDRTGAIRPAEKRNDLSGFIVPFVIAMFMAMIVMMTAGPMLPAIAEDKMQRVHEMLLASATPLELIAGKVLAALGRSLTSAVLYIGGAVVMLDAMAMMGLAPLELIPWFVVYMVAEVTMLCAMAAALGAACGSPQDAQSLAMVLFAPVIIPLFLITPVLQNPNSGFASAMSFVPPFTPMIMLLRQAMPGGVPA